MRAAAGAPQRIQSAGLAPQDRQRLREIPAEPGREHPGRGARRRQRAQLAQRARADRIGTGDEVGLRIGATRRPIVALYLASGQDPAGAIPNLAILTRGPQGSTAPGDALINYFHAYIVNPSKTGEAVNLTAAQDLIALLTSPEVQRQLSTYLDDTSDPGGAPFVADASPVITEIGLPSTTTAGKQRCAEPHDRRLAAEPQRRGHGGLGATVSGEPAGSPLRYSWDFGDGAPASTASAPSVAFASAGSYRVTLQASDAAGGGGAASITVTVSAGTETTAKPVTPTGPARSNGSQPGAAGGARSPGTNTTAGRGSGRRITHASGQREIYTTTAPAQQGTPAPAPAQQPTPASIARLTH